LLFDLLTIPKKKISLQAFEMAEKAHLMQLAACIQQAAATYDPSDRFSWMKIETALEGMRQAIQPPDFFTKAAISCLSKPPELP
jgi:hypothetical protein